MRIFAEESTTPTMPSNHSFSQPPVAPQPQFQPGQPANMYEMSNVFYHYAGPAAPHPGPNFMPPHPPGAVADPRAAPVYYPGPIDPSLESVARPQM
jgi:hypothetical protein